MRRRPQLGQIPRPLQEKATSSSVVMLPPESRKTLRNAAATAHVEQGSECGGQPPHRRWTGVLAAQENDEPARSAPVIMAIRDSSTLSTYGMALGTIAAAILVRALLTPLMGSAFPLATMFSAVAYSAWHGGFRPAMFTAVGGFLAADALFIPGRTLVFGRPLMTELPSVVVYLLSCASVAVLGEAGRRGRRRLEAGQRALAAANLALEQKVEAHGLLAAIVASTGDSIISTTLDGTITSWNHGAEQLLGYRAHEAVGREVAMLVPPERAAEERHILDRIRAGGRIDRFDTVRLTRDGEPRDVSLTVSPVHDRHGALIGASMVARDITLRKAAERQRLRNEEEHRLLVAIHDATRGLPDPSDVMAETLNHVGAYFGVSRCAYGEVDLDAGTVLITRGYARNVPTVAGRYPFSAFGEPLVAELTAGRVVAIDDVRRHPLAAVPEVARTYERMAIVAMVCVPLLRSGRLAAILVMADGAPRDWAAHEAQLLEQIAERTLFAVESARAAAALLESRDVLALAMGAGRMGAWSRDLVTGVVWWSRELETIVGLPPGGFDGSEGGFLAVVHPDDGAAVTQAVEAAVQSKSDYRTEFRFRHASGEWRWMEGRGKAVYSDDGTPRMLYGLGIDITERRRAVDALREADRRKDEFLATLAHELRNPLAPITSGLHILRATGGQGAPARKAREVIERQVAQMVRLVDDLLDVARISTGKTELRCAPMSLADAVQDAVETSAPLLTAGAQRLEVTLPSRPVVVHGDRTRLAQVFANLLNNSAKYSAPAQAIAIAVERDGAEAVVRVRDDGMGIPPESLPRIFDMFQQADGAAGHARGGLGIGLFLVKRIVEMHGGRVDAHSAGPGQGCEFVVRIPAVAQAEIVPEPIEGGIHGRGARRRILVVDDNADAAELLATVLTLDGHDTRLAHDGVEAMRTAGDYRPDLVFLDLGMPVLDGHLTAQWIRHQPWGKDVVLVALTGWGQAEDRRRSKESGFNYHLVKPADPVAIANLIASL